MTKEGSLNVQIESDSMYFGIDVPVEVRDSEMRLVKGPSAQRRFTLPVGLYEVSAVLEDGRRHRHLVQIKEQEEATAKLGPVEQTQAPEKDIQAQTSNYSSYERPRYTLKMESLEQVETEPQTGLTMQLIEVKGASLVREGRRHWVFGCSGEIESVANALVRVGDKRIRISLPVSPERPFPNNSCVVKVEETNAGVRINAWMAKERVVANALQNMMAAGYIFNAADMAKDAVGLLREKYDDPTGAALGALILYKFGRLGSWQSWVENLARDFDWLPDGKVLLAKLLYDADTDRERAFELAIRASSQRMLYSESFSILLDMLRRYPQAVDEVARKEAVERLASQAAYIDWESICLSHTEPEDE